MVPVLILSHGALAHTLVETAERIVGQLAGVQALSLDWEEPRESLVARLSQAIADLDQGDGVLILTDLFGDTPSNVALGLVSSRHVEVVTGVNLPMVLRLACEGVRPKSLSELATWIQAKGRQGIRVGLALETALAEDRR
jgi:PTS system mannose-specific IIA component